MNSNHKKKILNLILGSTFIVFITLILVICIEGASSFLLSFSGLKSPLENHVHTQYDPISGWSNKPNVVIKDMFGPKKNLTINDQGFRNLKNFSPKVPDNYMRIVCSGDSFAFGDGVGDTDTWCHKLTRFKSNIEAINLGQGGYSLGQSYLRYKDRAPEFEHDIHIFSFIARDFTRMSFDLAFGFYYRPIISSENGVLILPSEPVKKHKLSVPFVRRNVNRLNGLQTLKLIKKFQKKDKESSVRKPILDTKNIAATSSLIVKDLHGASLENNHSLVLVFLPMKADYFNNSSDNLRQLFKNITKNKNILFIDLFEDFRKISLDKIPYMFEESLHYSEIGNDWVAQKIYEKIEPLLSVK